MRTVNSFVAARRPTRALRQEGGMIDVSDENEPRELLLLKMALQTKSCVAFSQQPLIDGSVRRVARRTALAHRLMWKNKRTGLRRVALEAGFLLV